MRSFDMTEDMEFEVGGEKFKMRTVRPEVLASWEDTPIPDSAVEALKALDDRILLFIDNGDGSHDRWKALREREDSALSMGQLRAILEWGVEVQSALPTMQPSASARGRGKTAATSEAG
jgi:hypothetical protein